MKAQRFSDIPVAILCGGLATRLGERTIDTPKSMIKIAGKPFIRWQIEMLNKQGLTNIVLCLGHLWESIVIETFDLNCSYSIDGPIKLGTGGAIKKALPKLNGMFFVMYGDSYLPIDYKPIYDEAILQQKPACLSQWNGIDYGMNLYSSHLFEDRKDIFDINELQRDLVCLNKTSIFNSPSRYYEIGSEQGIIDLEKLLK